MRSIALFCLLVLLASMAQPGNTGSSHAADDIDRAWDACQAKMAASPEYRALKDKIGAHATQAMKSSMNKATPQEAAQVQVLHKDYVLPCRQVERESARRHNPSLVATLDAAYTKSDANFARLVAYQSTWGQFTRDSEAIKADLDAQLRRAQIMLEAEPQRGPAGR
jgi:hypothetical protein